MAPTSTSQVLLSPAELAYLHTSLSLTPPIRPDARSPTQFRPLIAETDILPGTYGSARICFADGTEAICGVKAEIEKSRKTLTDLVREPSDDNDLAGDEEESGDERRGENGWVELTVDIPGFRDDDSMPVFLSAMLSEALLADRDFTKRLWINRRFHWKLYIDIVLLSPALSYPLPLLSLTTHLALLSARLPCLKSEADEDPMFDDDWDASVYLYPRKPQSTTSKSYAKPSITLLVMSVGTNVIFDPSKEELAVADIVLAVSVAERSSSSTSTEAMDIDSGSKKTQRELRLLAVRTIDPPSRLTPPGLPNFLNSATGGNAITSTQEAVLQREKSGEDGETEGVWQAPRGGAKRKMVARMIGMVLERGGVVEEVLDGLEGVEIG